jgi:D-alanine-D-alanine ligase
MIVGIAYDLKEDFRVTEEYPDDWLEEYDSENTIRAIQQVLEGLGHQVVRLGGGVKFVERIRQEPVDLVFNLAEGGKGRSREAHIPALLEMLEMPYTHSDPLTLALTLDKEMTKRIIASDGIPTPDFRMIRNVAELVHVDLPFPLFVKPACEGSSKGIRSHSRVNTPEELSHEVERLLGDYGTPVLVEDFLCGREFTVGILGNGSPYVLAIMEVSPADGCVEDFVYSLVMKRECANRVRYQSPPPDVSVALLEQIEDMAIRSYKILGCRDVARVDFRLDQRGMPHVIEVNPLPGISPGYSDLVIMAGCSGWSYERLIETILGHALDRLQISSLWNAYRSCASGAVGRRQSMFAP